MNLTEKVNCGKLKLGVFNRKPPQYGAKPFIGLKTCKTVGSSRKDSTLSSKLNWGKSRQSISSSGIHSEASVNNEDSWIVLALAEGRGEARCEVGIAMINVSQPHLILCQISDTQSYDNTLRKINIFNPSQILVPMTFVESANQSRLIEKVKEQFPLVTYIPVRRNTYNKVSGMEFVQEYCVPSLNSVLLVLQYRYYALTAASALFRFLQNNLNVFYASGSIKIDYQESEGYAVIDVSTADRLELVSSTKPLQASKYSTLFGVLNNCYTRIGERALRTILLQPPFVTSIILERQECVTALMRHPEKLQSIQVMLQKLGNVDQLLTLPTIVVDDSQTCSNRQLNYILYLNGLVNLIITLSDVISSFDQPFFQNISVTLKNPDFPKIGDMVRTLIHENAYAAKSHNGLLQRCFAIKPGINGLLDLVRKIYSERLDDMREYVKNLGEKYDLPLTLGNNVTKGYHIVFSLNKHQRISMKKSDIPKEFIQICRLAGSFTMKTMELINFQTRIDDIIADILKISNVMIFKTLTSFKKYMGLFYILCEDIAMIDVLQSLAEVSIRNNYVKPTFSNFTEVKESQHPMLDMLAHEKPVPNLISSCQNFNVHVITGPNGSGKSIYIRQLMLLQIMAQIGGYVPASSAVLRPADRMFARVYLEDNMECGASSFVLEMKEIIYILSHITDSSLIIIDELARSTSLEEGTALAMAICERFVNSSAFVYLTSHFTLVTKLGDMYLNVKNWFMDTEASGDTPKSLKLKFKHSIKPGVTNLKRYGIFMVKNIWPADLLEDVYNLLEYNTKTKKEIRTRKLSRESRLKYNLDADLQKLRVQGSLNTSKVNELIRHYQVDTEDIILNIGNSYEGEIQEAIQENESHFDDSVPDDVLSEAVDQVENSLMSSQVDSHNSSYKRLSYFIGENSENINLLNPEIDIHEPPAINFEEGTKSFANNFNGRPNPNIKILSNVLFNEEIDLQNNNYPYINDQIEDHPNTIDYSQETYQNSQDFEEINGINRSLLTEMHIAKQNFTEMNSEIPYGDTVIQNADVSQTFDFMDTVQKESHLTRKTTAEIGLSEEQSYKSIFEDDNEVSDFCFLKPSEPPIKTRLTSKTKSPMNDQREDLDETDQITFSLGLLRNRENTSTPIIARDSFSSQEFRKLDLSGYKIDCSSNYSTGCISSQERSQPLMRELSPDKTDSINELHESERTEYTDSIDDGNNGDSFNCQKYTNKEYNENDKNKGIIEIQNSLVNKRINEGIHIFPEVNILQGPDNDSLTFGEEDKPCKNLKPTRLKKNFEETSITSKKTNIDKNLEQFVIEETKVFLSDSADIFDGDIDKLEITIENIEHSKISHEEVSENVISILKSEIIPMSKTKRWCDMNEEILMQDSQQSQEKYVESEPKSFNNPVHNIIKKKCMTEEKIGLKEHSSANDGPENSKYTNSTAHHGLNDKNPIRTFKPIHNLFEEPDLDTYLNNDLTIKKNRTDLGSPTILSDSLEQKSSLTLVETNKNNELIEVSVHDEKNENNSERISSLKNIIGENIESTEDIRTDSDTEKRLDSPPSRKNTKTISTSLSEASRKRNLDNSNSVSTCFDDQDDFKICIKKYKVGVSEQNKNIDIFNSMSTSPESIDEKISTPSKILTGKNNASDASNSRDKGFTSISDASRKRNLDNPTSASTSSNFPDVFVQGEKKSSDLSCLSKRLNELITPKVNTISNDVAVMPTLTQEKSDDNYEDCKENRTRKNSDSSNAIYETAVETDPFSEISGDNCTHLDKSRRKHFKEEKTEELHSKRYATTSKCSTDTFADSAPEHFEDGTNAPSVATNRTENVNQKNDAVCIQEMNDSNLENYSLSSNYLNENSSNQFKKKKYLGYRRRPKKQSKMISNSKKSDHKLLKKKSLFTPFKLSKTQIQEEFDKQDQIILEENLDVESYNKYLKQRMNRPSVKQIQNAEHIATFRKTENGTIQLPIRKKSYKPRKTSTKVIQGSKLIDVSIFSDQNASKMSAFLASKERNYNQFKFEPSLHSFDEDIHSLNFRSQFVQKTDRIKFNRSKSFGEFKFQKFTGVNHNNSFKFEAGVDCLQSQQSRSSSFFLPDGFLKDNKKDIDFICSKYLGDSNLGMYRTKTSPL